MKKVDNINIVSETPLPTPDEIRMELPVTAEVAENVWQFRQTVGNIVTGKDPRILMICGPCSIDSIPAAMEYAMHLRSLQEMLGHADISSTQVYSQLVKKQLKDVYNKAHPRA